MTPKTSRGFKAVSGGLTAAVLALAFSALASPTHAANLGILFQGADVSHGKTPDFNPSGNDPANLGAGAPQDQEYEADAAFIDPEFNRAPGALDGNILDLHGNGDNFYHANLRNCSTDCVNSEQCQSFNYVPETQSCRLYTNDRYTATLGLGTAKANGVSLHFEYYGKKSVEIPQQEARDPTNKAWQQAADDANSQCADEVMKDRVAWDVRAKDQPMPNAYTHWQFGNIGVLCSGVKPDMGRALPRCVNDDVLNKGMNWNVAVATCRSTMAN